jgi:molybdate transport system substrate-binding protein
LVATRLLNDEADLALHQISEIIAVKGAKLVGPLPAEIQNFTVYRAGLAAKSTTRTPAAAFIELMQSPSAKAILQDKGMEPPM